MGPEHDAAEEGPSRVTRLGAYAICREGDSLLLCRAATDEPEAGRWFLPGGGIEFGEGPADAVLRELEEESGLVGRIAGRATVDSHVGTADWPAGRVRLHWVRFLYPVEIVGGALRDEVGGSTDTCACPTREAIAGLPTVELVAVGLAVAFDSVGSGPDQA